LLATAWRTDQDSIFDLIKGMGADRWLDPSYYMCRPDTDRRGGMMEGSLTFAEATALYRDGLLNDTNSRVTEGHAAVNEHAWHAIMDFCGATYKAHNLLHERLASLPRRRDK